MSTILFRVAVPLACLALWIASYPADAAMRQSQDSDTDDRPSAGWEQSDRFRGSEPASPQKQEEGLMEMGGRGSTESTTSWKAISGEMKRIKKVVLRDTGEEHLAALLLTTQGRHAVVDLGLAQHYRDVKLRRGDWISARGPVVTVNDRHVIFARHVVAKENTISMTRRLLSPSSHRSTKVVRGQIAAMKQLKLKDGDKVHQVIRIVTKRGRQVVADLGEPASFKEGKLAYGQEVAVEGQMIRLSGKPFMVAQKVFTQGKAMH